MERLEPQAAGRMLCLGPRGTCPRAGPRLAGGGAAPCRGFLQAPAIGAVAPGGVAAAVVVCADERAQRGARSVARGRVRVLVCSCARVLACPHAARVGGAPSSAPLPRTAHSSARPGVLARPWAATGRSALAAAAVVLTRHRHPRPQISRSRAVCAPDRPCPVLVLVLAVARVRARIAERRPWRRRREEDRRAKRGGAARRRTGAGGRDRGGRDRGQRGNVAGRQWAAATAGSMRQAAAFREPPGGIAAAAEAAERRSEQKRRRRAGGRWTPAPDQNSTRRGHDSTRAGASALGALGAQACAAGTGLPRSGPVPSNV